ncbi:membrane protein insertase [Gammaproteobacteria bacterium]|nr:membrane protein insertase [Gammaproteobacteria bacterium]
MDNQKRTFLWIALGGISFFLITRWFEFNAPKIDPNAPELIAHQTNQAVPHLNVPTLNNMNIPGNPNLENASNLAEPNKPQLVHVKTDVLDVYINTLGGDITQAGLITYPKELGDKNEPFSLLADNNMQHFVSQTGLVIEKNSVNQSVPNYLNAVFSAAKNEYILEDGADTLAIPLTWTDNQGLTTTKTYTFKRGQFGIDYTNHIDNQSNNTWIGYEYRQLSQTEPPSKTGMMMASSYTGAVFSLPSQGINYEKETFKNIKSANVLDEDAKKKRNEKYMGKGGWISMIQHYFIAAWAPDQDETHLIYTYSFNQQNLTYYVIGVRSMPLTIAAGTAHTFKNTLYLGPKIQENLKVIAPKLELTVDFGWLSFISNLLFILLVKFHGLIGNWGWSIMLVTLTVKACLYWFAAKGFTSMARMRKFSPELQRLKEQYGDDKQKLNQEMMALYRKEKINPMSGCWPMLIQIPVFISLYWMLMESVELRQAPWALWIYDLSVMDPYYVLPLIMGATMFIQQSLNPAPPDPMQAKIMKWMPVMFTFMFLWFPAGLVLYWIVNNTLSIIQQWFITKRIEAKN